MLTLLLGCAASTPTLSIGEITQVSEDGLEAQLVIEGALEARVASGDGADLVLFYGGEERGSLEPCGCPKRPRGGLPRQAAYVKASRQANPDQADLILNGGYWLEDAMGLDGTMRPDTPLLNQWMIAGMQQLGVDALNVAYNDTAGLTSVEGDSGLPMVSANVSGPGITPYRLIQRGGLTIGVTGITATGLTFLQTPGFEFQDPVRAGRVVLETLRTRADVVILLAYQSPEAAKKLAKSGLVDVVIDTNLHREFYTPFWVGDAIWVHSHLQTMRLGELRLGLEDGQVSWAVDRKIDLDPEVPSEPGVLLVTQAAREELDALQRELYKR